MGRDVRGSWGETRVLKNIRKVERREIEIWLLKRKGKKIKSLCKQTNLKPFPPNLANGNVDCCHKARWENLKF
jgi:hypothetical protein